jgi:hypothetical protein
VGIGIALWPNQLNVAMLTNGVPVRLSSFTTHDVAVYYTVHTLAGVLDSARLTFTPGETVKKILLSPAAVQGLQVARVNLSTPVGGELTGDSQTYLASAPSVPTTTLIPFGSSWRYLDDGSNQGTAWRNPGFNDSGWSNGLAQLGFGDTPVDEATMIRRTNAAGATIATFYFRKSIPVANPAQFSSFSLQLLRDDAGIVYFNGREMLRSPNMPPGEVPYSVFTGGTAPPDNTIDATNIVNTGNLLSNGVNVVATEIHQQSSGSSDVSYDLELIGLPLTTLFAARFGAAVVLYWSDPSFHLECADTLPGNWAPVTGTTSPLAVLPSSPQKFYRLKNP